MSIYSPGVPEEHYAAIGRVADAAARIEQVIDMFCVELAGCETEIGLCLTAQVIGPGRKLDALLALLRLREVSAPTLAKAEKLRGKIIGLGDQRNRVLHDPWSVIDVADDGHDLVTTGLLAGLKLWRKKATHRTQVTAKQKLIFTPERVETGDLLNLVAKFEKATGDLLDLHRTVTVEAKVPPVRWL